MALFNNKKNEDKDKDKITTDDILMSLATTRTSINPEYMKNDAKRVVESLLYAIYTGNEQILPIDKMTDDYFKKIRDGLIRDKNNGIEKKLYNLEIKKVRPTNVDNSMMYLVTSVEFEIHFVVSYSQVHSTFNKKLTDELKIRYVFMNGTNYPNKKGWILGKDCDKREISSTEFDVEAFEQEQYQKQYSRRYNQQPYPQQGYPQQMQGGYVHPMNNGYNQMPNYMPQQGYNINQMPYPQQGYPQQGYPQQMQGGYVQPMNNGYNQMPNYMPQQGYNINQMPYPQQGYPQQTQGGYVQPMNNGYNNQGEQQNFESNIEQQNVPYNPLSQIHQAMKEQGTIKPIISPEMYNLDRLQATFGNKIIQEENQAYAGTIFQKGLSSIEENQLMEDVEKNEVIEETNLNSEIEQDEKNTIETNENDIVENVTSDNDLSNEEDVTNEPLDVSTIDNVVEDNKNIDLKNETLETINIENDTSNEIENSLCKENEDENNNVSDNIETINNIDDKKTKTQRKNKRKSLDELKKEAEDFDDLDTLETL